MTGEKTIPCLYCGEHYRFLAGVHFKRDDHFGDGAAFEEYKQWLAATYNIEPDDPLLNEPGQLTRPELWEKNRDRFPNWRNNIYDSE